MNDNYGKQASNHFADIRPDEREKLTQCRRNALASGFAASGIAWLFTRYLLTSTPLQNTFLVRHSGMAYTIVVGYALYQGVVSSGRSCIRNLATLENSRYGEFARRAITMHDDKKKLSRAEFLQKYPLDEQRKPFDPSQILTFDSSSGDNPATPAHTPEEPAQSNDMFHKTQQPEPSYRPKSFQDFQKENRARSAYKPYRDHSSPNLQESYNKPAKPSDIDGSLPPGPEDKSKVKRNKYGDVIYEE